MTGFPWGPLSSAGSLDEAPLARLLHVALEGAFTGILRLAQPSGPAEIYLLDGNLVAVELPGDVDRLGQVLATAGILDETRVRGTLRAPRPPGHRYGQLLVDEGLITPKELRTALRLQIRRRLHRLFFAAEGRYALDAESHGRGFESGELVSVHPYRGIWQGMRAAFQESHHGVHIGDGALRLTAPATAIEAFAFSEAEQALIVPLRDRPATAADLGRRAVENAAIVRPLLFTLLAVDAIALEGRAGSPSHALPSSLSFQPSQPGPSAHLARPAPSARRVAPEPPRPRTPSILAVPPPPAIAISPSTASGAEPVDVIPMVSGPSPTEFSRAEGSGSRHPSSPWNPPRVAPPRAFVPASPPIAAASAAAPPVAAPPAAIPPVAAPPTAAPPAAAPREAASAPPLAPLAPVAASAPVASATANPRPAAPSGPVRPPPVSPSAQSPLRQSGVSPDALARVITQKVSAIDTEDYFQVLGVDREADRVAIKNAYIAAARMYHPDRLGVLGTSSLRGDAERIFRRVSEAYATVSDDNRRGAYLAQLQRPATQKQVEVDAQRVVAGEMAFMEGEVAWKRRDYRTAIDRLEDAVRMNPSEGEAVGLLAYVRVIAGHASLAELRSEFERAVQLSPRSARCYYYLGLVIKDAGDLGNALKAFKRAVDIDPHLAAAHSEIRVLTMRNAKSGPQDGVRGLFDRLRKK